MYKFFEDISINNEEQLSEERIDNIKTSVLSRIKKEERTMKKCTTIKTVSIAAVAAATAMMSAMIASADLSQTPMQAQESDAGETSGWVKETGVEENVSEAPENMEADGGEAEGWKKITDVKNEETNPEPNETVDPETPDIASVYDEEWDVYYYCILPEEMRDKINSEVVPWDVMYEDGSLGVALYIDGDLVQPQELTYDDGKLVYTPRS